MDDFVVCYLDVILIYSGDLAQYESHVRKFLEKLRKYNLYYLLKKSNESGNGRRYSVPEIQPRGIEIAALQP